MDIEGTLALLSDRYFGGGQPSSVGNEKQKQQFARYLPPRLLSMQDMPDAIATAQGHNLMQAEYCIVSGPLCGTRISVSLAIHGLNIVLSHTEDELIKRLQRMQARWQRQLQQLGFPCLLEVTHAGESDG
ncbi:hypothetical protein [Yersinia pekkanenii]|nr:hypothetical protein [Yersinia pekkanenii]